MGLSFEIFRTSVSNHQIANAILNELSALFPSCKILFDLEDCDRILKIKGLDFSVPTIIRLVSDTGHLCQPLD
ncbi:MAG: hypothetical protein ABIV51_04725 [Saprospiraceae bacterium]